MAATAPVRREDVLRAFAREDLTSEARWYLDYNSRRYAAVLACVGPLVAAARAAHPERRPKLLDVAISFQTELLRRTFSEAQVDDIGFSDPVFKTPPDATHHRFDLNDARHRERWPELEGYDVITMSEVIEHLWISAPTSLACLASGLVPGGHLVVQTPNAVALHKRLRVLAGRSAIAPLPDGDPAGVAHLHEYTLGELLEGGRRAGLEPVDVQASNYFGTGRAAAAYFAVGRVLPRTLRHGFTVVFRAAR